MAASYAVVTGTLGDTAAETKDFTSSGFGTPKGALIFAAYVNSTNNPQDHLAMSVGFWDGTNVRCSSTYSSDGESSASDNCRINSTTHAVFIAGAEQDTVVTYTITNITDGIRLTVDTDNTSVERYATVILLGDGASVDVGTIIPDASVSGTAAISSLSYEPDLVFFSCVGAVAGVENTVTEHNILSYGVAVNDGAETQRALMMYSDDNVGTSDCTRRLETDSVGGQLAAALTWTAELTAFAADGFTLTTRDGVTNIDIMYYMAVNLDGLSPYLATLTTPTSTGANAITGVGFQPGLAMLCGRAAAVDTTEAHASFDIGASDGTTSRALAVCDEDNLGTTDSTSRMTTGIYNSLTVADGTDLITAALTTFDADGRTYNYTAVDASARYGWELLLEAPGGGNDGTGALAAPVTTSSGAGVVEHVGSGTPSIAAITAAGVGLVKHIATGALTIGVATLSGTGIFNNDGIGALSTPAATISGTGAAEHIGTGSLTVPSTTASGYDASAVTVTGTYNKSYGDQQGGDDAYEAAFLKFTAPDLTGQTPQSAELQLYCTTNTDPAQTFDVYCDVAGNDAGWTEATSPATLAAMTFNAAVATGELPPAVNNWHNIDISGAAGVNGILKVYDDDITGGIVTIKLYNDTTNEDRDVTDYPVVINDWVIYAPRTHGTLYWRVVIDYTPLTNPGALTTPAATVAGTGAVEFVGTGALDTPVPEIAGDDGGTQGGITIPMVRVRGDGQNIPVGSGTPETPVPVVSGTGVVEHVGTGALVIEVPLVWGIYDKSDVVIPIPEVDGTGTVTNNELGTLLIPAVTITGLALNAQYPTDPDDGSVTLNMNFASSTWRRVHIPNVEPELRRAIQTLASNDQQIVTNINQDLNNTKFRWLQYSGP